MTLVLLLYSNFEEAGSTRMKRMSRYAPLLALPLNLTAAIRLAYARQSVGVSIGKQAQFA
jgi:hypothetical protein